jgi:hypothetical protein
MWRINKRKTGGEDKEGDMKGNNKVGEITKRI